MAWIKIYDRIFGNRLIDFANSISCSENEAIGIIVRLWLWAITKAESSGIIIGSDGYELEEVISQGTNIDSQLIKNSLIEYKWVEIRNEGIFIRHLDVWQEEYFKSEKRKIKDRERKSKKRQEQVSVPMMSIIIPQEDEKPKIEPKPKTDYQNGFEEWWKEYPRKVDKGQAYKKYTARINDGWTPEQLMVAVKNYAWYVKKHNTKTEYIKHAKTFLSDSTPFVDFIPKKTREKLEQVDEGNPFAEWKSDERIVPIKEDLFAEWRNNG